MIKIKLKKPFKLYDTVTCGQIFRFFQMEDGSFDVILKDRVINVYQKDDVLFASSNDEEDLEKVIRNYFDLDNDYEKMDDYLIQNDVKIKDAGRCYFPSTLISYMPSAHIARLPLCTLTTSETFIRR